MGGGCDNLNQLAVPIRLDADADLLTGERSCNKDGMSVREPCGTISLSCKMGDGDFLYVGH
jgi:hypothetical protein